MKGKFVLMKRIVLSVILAVLLCGGMAFAAPGGVKIVCTSSSAPIDFGLSDLEKATAESNLQNVRILVSTGSKGESSKILKAAGVKLPAKAESFVIARSGSTVVIAGSNDTGTMYGLFELAERLHTDGAAALSLKKPVVQSPNVEFRAVNPFLVLPYGDEKNWWFLSDDFWTGYIDMLAKARINWIDLHGMYDIKSTVFHNIYPYFIKSDKYPDCGVTPEEADRNLAMLKKVMKMAKNRGIRFAMMSYAASWNGPGLRKSPYEGSEDNLAEYTREMVRKTIQSCPDLAMIGFRIGESGKKEDFFRKSYIPAIKESGRNIDLYTRSWGANKDDIMALGKEFPGRLFVEIKYNGEQYGPAHIVAGGRVGTSFRGDYSYQDFFAYPRPYKVIWQVRVNGTHRVFPWGSPDFVSRTSRNSHLEGTVGFCTEPINGYYPAYNYLQKDDSPYKWYKWCYQRDWFFYDVWGRLSYNPDLSQNVWIRKFQDRYGKKVGEPFYKAFTTASEIVPYAFTFYSLGPDHRNHAPELETGGGLEQWINEGPFDGQNVQSPVESARRAIDRDPSARLSTFQAADMLSGLSTKTLKYLDQAKKVGSKSKEFGALTHDMEMLSHLGNYYSDKFRSVASYAAYKQTHAQWLADSCRSYHEKATYQWKAMAKIGDAQYKPFVDKLKMKTEQFTWTKEGEKLATDIRELDEAVALAPQGQAVDVPKDLFEARGDKTGPVVKISKSYVSPAVKGFKTLTVKARVVDPAGVQSVLLKFKPEPSEAVWRVMEMKQDKGLWVGSVGFPAQGLMWCIETLDKDDNGTLWPDFRNDIPYRVINAWDDTAVNQPDVSMALDAIIGKKIGGVEFTAMFIGRESKLFNQFSPALKAKVLETVKNGLSLVVEWQDLSTFDLSWLPGGVSAKQEEARKITFDMSCPILRGMKPEAERSKIVQGSLISNDPEWKFAAEPKALAYRKYGNGWIILSQINRRNRVEVFGVQLLDSIMNFVGEGHENKTVLLLDPGDSTTGRVLLGNNVRVVTCEK